MRSRLEQVGASFLGGYHAALEHSVSQQLIDELETIQAELRGFAYEGAAMGLALLDLFTPWQNSRLGQFLKGSGNSHTYMVHVGVGWIWARTPGLFANSKGLDPLLRWLAFDGWGFHDGFFHGAKYLRGHPAPKRLKGYERRVFDQGLGRSLWFINGGRPERISASIQNLAPERHGDLWGGVGLAATYAGIVSAATLGDLRERCGQHWPQLAQGAAFAAKARQRAGNISDYTNLAVDCLCGVSVSEAAQLCDRTLENLPATGPQPPYEVWRERIQKHFAESPQLQTA